MSKISIKSMLTILLAAILLPAPTLRAAEMTEQAKAAIAAALEDEYKAEAFYAAVIEKFGEVRPFSNIIMAERQHAAALQAVMANYNITYKSNPFIADKAVADSVPATIRQACSLGIEAEIANRDLYDQKLLPAVADYADVTFVMTNLKNASEQRHLPAFQRCGGN